MRTRLGGWLVSVTAALVILGVSIAPFLSPPAIHFEQSRTAVYSNTGYTWAKIDEVTTSIVADLLFWTGDFEVIGDGPARCCPEPALNDAERAHMRDVRVVFTGLWVLVAGSVGLLVAAFRRAGTAAARAAAWRSVSRGAKGLAAAIALAGAFAAFAFDAAFEVFHRLFFSAGTYTFDPATSKLVQLFPDQFWFEITMAVGAVVIVLSVVVAWVAGRRARAVAPAGAAQTLTSWTTT